MEEGLEPTLGASDWSDSAALDERRRSYTMQEAA